MSDISKLEPKEVWSYFHDITRIPRPSKKEKRIADFIVDFGKNHKLETIVDKAGNVVIRKPATKGMEKCKGIILQTHLDMVHRKTTIRSTILRKIPSRLSLMVTGLKQMGLLLVPTTG